jgi:hypothetical protein
LSDAGLHFLGAVPEDKLLRAVRLDEVQIAMEADFKFGSRVQLDQVCLQAAIVCAGVLLFVACTCCVGGVDVGICVRGGILRSACSQHSRDSLAITGSAAPVPQDPVTSTLLQCWLMPHAQVLLHPTLPDGHRA